MIIKRMYEEYDLSIERILLKEYRRLKLSMVEMSVLIALFSIYKKRRTFTIAAISRRVDYNQEEIGNAVESLIDKGFVHVCLENKDGKEREIFHLDQAFHIIEELFRQDDIERIRQISESDLLLIIKRFEQGLGRVLLSYELETIRRWFEDKLWSTETILKAIDDCQDQVSIKRVERMLSQSGIKPIEIDAKVDAALDRLYKKIK